MSVFTAGIVWDPREPLPPEFQPQSQSNTRCLVRSRADTGPYHPAPELEHSAPVLTKLPDGVVQENTRNTLPPHSVSITGRIFHDTAGITVSQVFWNNVDDPIPQASYVFPLPSGCTVTNFTCRIGRDKILRAKAQPKEEARRDFQKAILSGRSAALLEQNTPEIFTTSLGNIPPSTRLEIKLTYIVLLKRHFSEESSITTLSIPTAIAHRYGSAPKDIPTSGFQNEPRTFTLELSIFEAKERLEIDSYSHKIFIDRNAHNRQAFNWRELSQSNKNETSSEVVVKLDPTVEFLSEDFILTIESSPSSGATRPHAWLESHPTLESQKAMMITIPASLMMEGGKVPETGEILFLADRSGSMRDKIDAVKSSLNFFLNGIPVGWKFNIWSFGTMHTRLWDESQIYSAKSLELALKYVKTEFKADMGGTELVPALKDMLQSRDLSNPCDVIIMSDGEVWRLEEALALVQETRTLSRGAVRFFSLGIGAHVSHALVHGIASRGGGYSEVIPAANLDGWEDRVVSMLKTALTSHVSNLNVTFNGESYDRYLRSPNDIGNLSILQGNRIYVLSTPDSTLDHLNRVTIEAIQINGARVCHDVSVELLPNKDSTIHNVAVRAILGDLEYSINVISNAPTSIDVPMLEDTLGQEKKIIEQTKAVELACRFSILSKWTSFFLQQENAEPQMDEYMCTVLPVIDSLTIHNRDERMCCYFTSRFDRYLDKTPERRFPASQEDGAVAHSAGVIKRDSRASPLRRPRAKTSMTDGKLIRMLKRPAKMAAKKESADSQRELVIRLLRYQSFDGSIDVGVQSLLEPSLAQAARELQEYMVTNSAVARPLAAPLAYTIIVAISLERHLQECKKLWDLMRVKALNYISSQVPDESKMAELMDFASALLAGKGFARPDFKSVPCNDEAGQSQGSDKSEPTPIHVAPLD
ncbi:von Willebrand factor type A domain-containing protein [Hypoxylon sp. FL1284]|nr:von Willebrand factor type A domain-containing protein [Hypoxylon sp. FL1284]